VNQPSFDWNPPSEPREMKGTEPMSETFVEQGMMDKIKELESKVVKVVSAVKEQREENRVLQAKITALEDELRTREQELARLRHEGEDSERMKQNLNVLREERAAVRNQVEELLRELETVELG